MNKRVLIISPHFPPINSADMHRVRHMLNYLEQFGWIAEIVTVDPKYIDAYSIDPLLLKTLPCNIKIHSVKAWDKKFTGKFGLGSISIRSYFFYKKDVNNILKKSTFDLIFFSTTAFHLMALGPYWKKKFAIPFVLDIQDPWRSDFYLDKPKSQRPPKFWISYNIDKILEAKSIPFADGIISVSSEYIELFKARYNKFNSKTSVIPFSAFEKDFELLDQVNIPSEIGISNDLINIIYVGRGGYDLSTAVEFFFSALLMLKNKNIELFNKLKVYFIGTSYAPKGKGIKTIFPIAVKMGLSDTVIEFTDRQEYYVTLKLLKTADILFIPGSSDSSYTASKIYPYILAEKPILACFHEKSSVVKILEENTNATIITFNSAKNITNTQIEYLYGALLNKLDKNLFFANYNKESFKFYLADAMTERICGFFNEIIKKNL